MDGRLLHGLFDREQARQPRFQEQLRHRRNLELEFSRSKAIQSAHAGGVLWLDLDHIDHRYLIAGAADGSVAAYDVQVPSSDAGSNAASGRQSAPAPQTHKAVFSIAKGRRGAHKFGVSGVFWYPVDTGLFVTGSFDHDVKIWDANHLDVVGHFQLESRVYTVAMSPVATTHCLISAAGTDPQVKLCDAASGGFTHTLVGHREPVWAACWSPTSEWHLVTGGCDGQVRYWDIRQSGCLHCFDQHDTHRKAHRTAADAKTPSTQTAVAHDGCVTAVKSTADGLHWLTAGTDSRVRSWQSDTFRNTLVNFPNSYNRSVKELGSQCARQLAMTDDSHILFHPSGSVLQMFRTEDGKPLKVLRGHMETINGCAWNPDLQELYSGADDCTIIVWTAPQQQNVDLDPSEPEARLEDADADAWSESD